MHPNRTHDPGLVRLWRVKAGLNLDTAAARAGWSKSHLSNVERGKKGASVEKLARLAKAYGCEVFDFVPVAQRRGIT